MLKVKQIFLPVAEVPDNVRVLTEDREDKPKKRENQPETSDEKEREEVFTEDAEIYILSLLDKTNLAKIEQAATTVLDDIKEIESEISRLHGKKLLLEVS